MRGLLVAFVIALATVAAAYRERPPTAQAVLAKVRAHYAALPALRATLRVTSQKGETFGHELVATSNPARFRADFSGSLDSSMRFDGTYVWIVDHANRTIFRTTELELASELDAALLFVTGGAQRWPFSGAIHTTGASELVLELRADYATAPVQRVSYAIDPDDWHVKEAVVVDKHAETTRLQFVHESATPIDPTMFTVDPSTLPYAYNAL